MIDTLFIELSVRVFNIYSCIILSTLVSSTYFILLYNDCNYDDVFMWVGFCVTVDFSLMWVCGIVSNGKDGDEDIDLWGLIGIPIKLSTFSLFLLLFIIVASNYLNFNHDIKMSNCKSKAWKLVCY